MTASARARETERLLRRLSVRGAMLIVGEGGRCRLTRDGRRGRRETGDIDADIIGALQASRHIAPSADGTWRITGAGRAHLRRSLLAAQHPSRRQEHGTVVLNDPSLGAVTVAVNHEESPLSWLRRRKGRDGSPLIDAAEFAAGERLRSDYTRGLIMPRVTANWTATVAGRRRDGGAGGIAELTEAAIAARRRVGRALAAVGPEFQGVLVDFCCFLKGLEEIERERQWPARSAKVVVRMALARLARHYGLIAKARGPDRAKLSHWGAADYRPTIEQTAKPRR